MVGGALGGWKGVEMGEVELDVGFSSTNTYTHMHSMHIRVLSNTKGGKRKEKIAYQNWEGDGVGSAGVVTGGGRSSPEIHEKGEKKQKKKE